MHPSSSTSSSEDLRAFALRAFALLVLVFLADRLIGGIAGYLYARTRDGDTGETVNALLEHPRDVVVFGSSRAESHYNPEVLGRLLGASVFNGGFKGSNVVYDYGLEQLVLDHYVPKLIVYDFSAIAVEASQADPYKKLYPLYPFWRNPHIWALIAADGPRAELPFVSRIYPFSSKIHSLLIFNAIDHRPGAIDGYDGSRRVMPEEPVRPLLAEAPKYDPRLVAYLVDFLDLALRRGSRVVIVESPRHALGSFPLPAEVSEFVARHSVPLIDFNVDAYAEYRDHRLFRDLAHLNDSGATRFSEELGARLLALGVLPRGS